MHPKKCVSVLGAIALFVAIVFTGISLKALRVLADDDNSEESKIQRGFEIAPVLLNLAGKNRALVGLGSYIVNAQADCNGCHSAGPATEFAMGGNPYLLRPFFSGKEKVNPKTYLGGGRDFGPLVPGSVDIVSRNLTPDKTGLPEGGHTLREFIEIIRTGVDMDHLHPATCPPNAPNPSCVPFPFDGTRLQIMPWPVYRNMTDHDLEAIYEYLSTIPCIDTIVPGQPQLRNNCP
jgi:hypothetical protein